MLLIIPVSLTAQSIEDTTSTANFLDQKNWQVRGGSWDFSKKIFKAQGYLGHNKAWFKDSVFSDFIYEVRLKKLDQNGSFGVLFGYAEELDEGYLFCIWPYGGHELQKIKGGQVMLKRFIASDLKNQVKGLHIIKGLNVWNTFKIVASGSHIDFYINGHLTCVVNEKNYKSGRLGLYVGGDPKQRALFEILTLKSLKNGQKE